MKYTFLIVNILLFSKISFGQIIISGEYSSGLKLAYDSISHKVSGYFEDHSGWDESTKSPKFSCIFYFEGKLDGKNIPIKSYYPSDSIDDLIMGKLEILNKKEFQIKLAEDHGGCWNVRHFADEPVAFSLAKFESWVQIGFVMTEKAYLYDEKSIRKRKNSYLVKNDFVCIEKIEDNWAYCTYYGNTINKGWIQAQDLNTISK